MVKCCGRGPQPCCRWRSDIFSFDAEADTQVGPYIYARMHNWLIWQLADSAFPTGGFAHSFGLEAAWHQDEVDATSLPRFVSAAIGQAARSGLPFVTHAHRHPEQIAM